MEEKLFSRTYPKCGNIYKGCQFAKADIGIGIHANMMCEQGHKWTEFYSLSYQGFWWDGKRYDSYGKEEKNLKETT